MLSSGLGFIVARNDYITQIGFFFKTYFGQEWCRVENAILKSWRI